MKGRSDTKADDLNSKDASMTALETDRQQVREETLRWISVSAISTLRLAWRRKPGLYRLFDRTDHRF